MEHYDPTQQTIRISNLTYGLLKWFYNGGHYKSCKRDEALYIDQRVFGPANAKGLIAFDGTIWYLTNLGKLFVENFERRDAWKDTPSKDFSHYVKLRKSMMRVVRSRPTRQEQQTA